MLIASTGFRTDLMILERSGSQIVARDDHLVVHTPANPGYWWGNFLLLCEPLAPGSADRWRRIFAHEFPAARHFALGIDGITGDAGDQAVIDELHLNIGVDAVLASESPLLRPEVDAEIRPITSDDDWERLVGHRGRVDGRVSDAAHARFVRQRAIADRRLCEAGDARWFGAFVGGRLVSSAGVVTDGSGIGRYQLVMTDPDHRRRGLASAVVSAAGHWAQHGRGVRQLIIVADPDDVAIGVYRRLGFVESERQVSLERG